MMRVVIVSNTSTYMVRFRSEFMLELKRRGCDVIVLSPVDQYAASLKWPAVKRVTIGLQQHGVRPTRELWTFLQIIRWVRKLKPRLVINFTLKPAIYGSLAARLCRVPDVVSVFTGLGTWFTATSRFRSMLGRTIRVGLKIALSNNKRVIFQNVDDQSLFVDAGISASDKARVVDGSGVNIEQFCVRSPAPEAPIFLMVARLIEDKGVREYAAAAAQIRARYPLSRCVLVGPIDTSPGAIQSTEVQQWINSGSIEYLGELSDVRDQLDRCSVFVLPSYREGTPRSVLEALAMGRPVITTDAPGCRETVLHGVSGFLVQPRAVEELAEAMERFILDPGLARNLGAAARETAVNRYDVRKVSASLLAAIGIAATE